MSVWCLERTMTKEGTMVGMGGSREWRVLMSYSPPVLGLFLIISLFPTAVMAQNTGAQNLKCGVVGSKSDLPGVTLAITSDRCSFSQKELREGVRFDYEVIVQHEMAGVLPLPQDLTGCQKPGKSGLITFRVIRGDDQVFCPQCDLGPCLTASKKEETILHSGRYRETLLWNGQTFTGDAEGMSTVPKREFPPGWYLLSIRAIGHRRSSLRGEALVPFTITLDYRVNVTDGNQKKAIPDRQQKLQGVNLP
jgi:hypothetical protein